jgi:anhydro-N-acetylmuramic acid kinase
LDSSGGIGNVTLVPHRLSELDPIAFDTGPGNVFIDMAAGKANGSASTDGEHSFDKDGALAASGCVCTALLEEMMKHPYLSLKPPKTTGREVAPLSAVTVFLIHSVIDLRCNAVVHTRLV